ncbi:MAG TPA: hypothetical protein VNO70_27455, partial [Blastocatellia bacterium]|nr:hypothetical protein [Blastocatellia bacterium]
GAQPQDGEIELLFALDGFANAAQLYARVSNSLRDRERLRAATFSLAQQAVRTDRVFTTISSRAAESLAPRWDAIRQDVLKLMREHNIRAADLGN